MIKVTDMHGAEDSYDADSWESDGSGRLYVRKRGQSGPVAMYAPGQWAKARLDEDAPAEDGSEGDAATTIDAR